MEGITNLLNKTKNNMGEHVARLERDLATIRTGRASAGLLENIRVDYYGTPTPIKQMAVINILDAKTLEIQPWDISSLNDIDRALQKADLGASPVNDGKVIRITLPSMTEDRRKQLAKNISKMSEDFKVAVRNERRDVLGCAAMAVGGQEGAPHHRGQFSGFGQPRGSDFGFHAPCMVRASMP